MIYFISDTHFYHSNIIKYCNRTFKDVNEMNETIISNWRFFITKDDIVYHLGDFCLSSDDDIKNIFNRLNGNKILIRGNHDRKSVKFYKDIGFDSMKKVIRCFTDLENKNTYEYLNALRKNGFSHVADVIKENLEK